jgi:hypothetical protein
MIVASTALIAFVIPSTRAADAGTPAARWAELAAAHRPETCSRCRPAVKPVEGVADVVRRLRGEGTPRRSAPAGPIDLAAELAHVAATSADDQPRQAMRIADELAPRDMQAGAAFAAALPAGRIQNAAMLAVIGLWIRTDRRAPLEWGQALADEPTRRAALDEVARRLVGAAGDEAPALAANLPAGPGRDDALCAVARHWARIDRPAALAWVQGFPDSAPKVRMLKAISE